MNRIVVLIDMDCFYVQVEQRDQPETRGKPCAVAQYNGAMGGGIIAVSYEARAEGVKRGMREKAARASCPSLILFKVPEKRGKADLNKYRAAGAEVIQCITEFADNVERASIDEAYIDLTDFVDKKLKRDNFSNVTENAQTTEAYVLLQPQEGTDISESTASTLSTSSLSQSLNRADWMHFLRDSSPNGCRYALASALTYHIRQTILRRTGFFCSAGIAPNKTLAKLACSLNKPNKQTIVLPESASLLLQNTPIQKIRNLGGKLGSAIVSRYGFDTLGQLADVSLSELTKEFGEKTANWLYDLCRGHDTEPVTVRQLSQSIGCSKIFPGRNALHTTESIRQWLHNLAAELVERLEADRREHRRQATRLTLCVRTGSENTGFSRVLPSTLLTSIGLTDAAGATSIESESSESDKQACTPHEDRIVQAALRVLQEQLQAGDTSETWSTGIRLLSLNAGKFSSDITVNSGNLRSLLEKQQQQQQQEQPREQQQEIAKSTETDHQPVADHKVIATYSPCDSNSPLKTKRKLSPNPLPMCDGSTTTTTTTTTTSFFKRLRVAELSAPSHPVSIAQSSTGQLNPANTVQQAPEVEPTIEANSNSRSSVQCESAEAAAFFTSYAAGDWIICDECGSRVSVWQVPEHSDFHVAQRVQNEWAREVPGAIAAPQSSTSTSATTSANRGSGRIAPRGRRKAPTACGTLDRFIRPAHSP